MNQNKVISQRRCEKFMSVDKYGGGHEFDIHKHKKYQSVIRGKGK